MTITSEYFVRHMHYIVSNRLAAAAPCSPFCPLISLYTLRTLVFINIDYRLPYICTLICHDGENKQIVAVVGVYPSIDRSAGLSVCQSVFISHCRRRSCRRPQRRRQPRRRCHSYNRIYRVLQVDRGKILFVLAV